MLMMNHINREILYTFFLLRHHYVVYIWSESTNWLYLSARVGKANRRELVTRAARTQEDTI